MKLKIAIVSVAILVALCGCSSETQDGGHLSNRFVTVEQDGRYSIVVDSETNVMYLRYESEMYKYGFTVLLNADGSPMLWGE